ncbi:hypothetical protein [Hyphomicrobium sp. NDB2Meth4]|uniref:hypothetical protein n=1 Tax=Hyphomicrobium sp. NDB2Meth4 TaxID=1892846 RepID=UPI0009320254|nr:hypothetical protein [Hyphomicrobium sp. NDB2Meth4]
MASWWERLLRIEPGISIGQWVYDRVANNWDRLGAAFLAGGGMSYLASITDWMVAWGPLGVGAAGLSAALTVWVGLALASSLRAKAKIRQAEAAAIDKWKQEVDSINPLAAEFHTKRIRVEDLAHPIDRSISDKRLIDCELIGPANLVLLDNDFKDMRFYQCDTVVVRANMPINNAIALRRVKMIGGSLWNCTLLIPPQAVKTFADMGAVFTSPTGVPEIDNLQPQAPEGKTPR